LVRSRFIFIFARLFAAAFALLSAIDCLLAYLPFTYHQVYLGGLLPWLTVFTRIHPYLYWVAFAAAVISLPDLRIDRSRAWTVLFIFVYGAIGIRLSFYPVLDRLDNDVYSLIWCIIASFSLIWLGALDWLAQRATLVAHPADADSAPTARIGGTPAVRMATTRIFNACLLTALYVSVFSATVVIFARARISGVEIGTRPWLLAFGASLLSHLMVFLGIFLILNFTGAIADILSKSARTQALLYAAVAAAALALALKSIVFVPLSFTGWAANGIALLMGCGIVSVLTGMAVRAYRPEQCPIASPMALFFAPAKGMGRTSLGVRIGFLLLSSSLAGWALLRAAKFDWEYLIQTLVLLVFWVAVFVFFYLTGPAMEYRRSELLVVLACALLCLNLIFGAIESKAQTHFSIGLPAGNDSLERYADYDVGFRLARSLLSPRETHAGDDDSLYSFLAENTNIPRSVHTSPVEIELAGKLVVTAGPKPNIFIFVIDSLRRDYLSPYNPSVTFTPEIAAFARESSVARNAFTRYCGTGLSEPSIWAGSMLLHKQYVTPFHPMNSLEKLLAADGYRQFVTKDEILSMILAPSAPRTELDAGVPTMNCELCRSLAELQGKITATGTQAGPIFAYTQPQDVHISVINRARRSVLPGGNYAGFDAAYASRIARLDKCFGEFIRFLKQKGLYDNSIVIVTSDHGDSLGERGRWGHAYNVVPEVVRVPLIIHLPTAMQSLAFAPNSTAFLTDITPSLYYLLGHRPIQPNRLFGRPLFTQTPAEAAAYAQEAYLVASSYAPVYGILSGDGRSLYVVDGVSYKDSFYTWDEEGSVSNPAITAELRGKNQQAIRDDVGEIGRLYHFSAAGQAVPN
jgi:Sulfatase